MLRKDLSAAVEALVFASTIATGVAVEVVVATQDATLDTVATLGQHYERFRRRVNERIGDLDKFVTVFAGAGDV